MAEEKPLQGIVVWRMEAKTGVTENDIDSISGYVTAEVEKYSGLKAVSEADIQTILGGEQKKQMCGVEGGTSCIAEIGSALGVPEAVSGDLGRMGDYWLLNLRRIHVRKAQVVARVGRQIKGDVNALIEAVPGAVAELFGKEAPKPVAREPEVKVQKPVEPPKPVDRSLRTAAFATFFPGLALAALGGVGQWQMGVAKDDYEGGDQDAKSRHDTWKGVTVAGYGVGGALVATGIVLWIVDAVKAKGEAAPEASPVSAACSPLPGGASAQVMFTW